MCIHKGDLLSSGTSCLFFDFIMAHILAGAVFFIVAQVLFLVFSFTVKLLFCVISALPLQILNTAVYCYYEKDWHIVEVTFGNENIYLV